MSKELCYTVANEGVIILHVLHMSIYKDLLLSFQQTFMNSNHLTPEATVSP